MFNSVTLFRYPSTFAFLFRIRILFRLIDGPGSFKGALTYVNVSSVDKTRE